MNSKNKTDEKEAGLVEERDLKKENEELYAQLTNKNKDYFFQLNSRLDELSYNPESKTVVINHMLQETVEFQEEAITARKMYGTVTERADQILGIDPDNLESESETSPTEHLYLDGALLLGGMFSMINGFSAWRGTTPPVGLLQLLMNFLLGGLVVLVLLKYRPEAGKNKGFFKYTLVTAGTIMAWIFAMTFVEVAAPSFLNPQLPDFLIMSIGAVGLLARWYFKKKLAIKGTLF